MSDRASEPGPPLGGRIRVLRLITRMNVGGPARQITGLAAALDPQRFEQRLLAGEDAAGEADYVSMAAPHLEVVRVPGLRRLVDPLGDIQALPQVRREILEFQPHVLHTHLTKAGVIGRVAALTCGARRPRLVHTFHGHVLYGILSPRTAAMAVRVERTLARRTDTLLSVGARVRDELLAAGVGQPDQFVVVPPGVSIADPPPSYDAKASLGLSPDDEVITFVGRLSTQKRPDRFVEMARYLAPRRPRTVFLVVGGGELEFQTRGLSSSLGERFRFLGWRSDIETVLAASDIAMLTSDNEGMPVALIEAGMAGVASVATDVGSTAEVVLDGTTGLIRPPDGRALADAAEYLLRSPDLRRAMASAAREHCRANFSVERLARDVASIYETAVSRSIP